MTHSYSEPPQKSPQKLPQKPHRSGLVAVLVDWLPNSLEVLVGKLPPALLWGLMGLLMILSLPLIVTPITLGQQALVALVLVLFGWGIVQLEQSRDDRKASEYLHLLIIWVSALTTLRYLHYRTSYTLKLDNWVDGIFSVLLYMAELYAIMTLFLSYFQTLKLRDRQPVDLANFPQEQWFSVDIYIPTYNEDVEIVRKTALGALAVDYPEDKKRVYILDDGRKYPERRQELRRMCEELGCEMLTRDNNDHAKAGNINTAMHRTSGDLIMILDCDHIPSRQFLQHTVGFFFNPKVSLVQTPHWFYNPDPFERNLLTGGRVPVGNELFYKVLQKGNDFWNSAFFCGSAAVIRKSHVLEVGGIAVETVTEDCHTSFRLHSRGYESVYYDKIMIAGLAPEKFSSYVGQQVRWARGMAQILRLENPLLNLKLKLSLSQRLCYFSATSHFFYGFPRLMYAIAPTLFLLFGINPIRGLGLETLAYALPHIILSTYANFIPYKNVRFSFWNEIYEFAMSFQAGIVTFLALINPRLGNFNVTDKGSSITKRTFDWESSQALVIVAVLVAASLAAVPLWLIYRPEATEAALINAFWSCFNLVLLVSALLVAFEQPQLRIAHRLERKLPVTLYSPGQTLEGKTLDISERGCRLVLDNWPNLPDEVELEILGDFGARAFVNGRIVRAIPTSDNQVVLAIDYIDLSRAQQDALCIVIYSDVGEWYAQNRQEIDRPLDSFRFIATSLLRSFQPARPARGQRMRKKIEAAVQLYWEGQFYSGVAREINSRSLRIELPANTQNLQRLGESGALVGLLLSQDATEPLPSRLLAQVIQVEQVIDPLGSNTTIELSFPEQVMEQQRPKIRNLLRTLH